MSKKLLTFIFGMIFLISILSLVSAGIISVTLNSPEDNSILNDLLTIFNGSANTSVGYLTNATLYDNSTGSWDARNTTDFPSLSGTDAHGVTISTFAITQSNKIGVQVTIGAEDLRVTSISKTSSSTATKLYVRTSYSTGLYSASFVGSTATFDEPIILESGQTYFILTDNGGSNYNSYRSASAGGSFPYVGTNLNWIAGVPETGTPDTNYLREIKNITYSAKTSSIETFTNTYLAGYSILWNMLFCNTEGGCEFAPSNFTFTFESNAPVITIVSGNGTQNFGSLTTNHKINYTITDTNLETCWLNYNGTNITIPCTSGELNTTNFKLQYNIYNAIIYANDSLGNLGSLSFEWDYNLFQNSFNYSPFTYETASEIFYANITTNGITINSAEFIYNTTSYNGVAITSLGGNNYNISKSINIPLGITNNSLHFNLTLDGVEYSLSSNQQNISETTLSLCNATYTTPFINFTFKDEGNSSNIIARIPTSTFVYWLGDGTINKTLTYSNNSENTNYTFCFSPNSRSVNVDIRMQYDGADYPQRIYNPTAIVLNSTVTNKVLYLLSTDDGQYVTFQVINLAEQTISNVEMNATREISGSNVIVGQGTTGDDGTVTLWLNPNFIHTYGFFKAGIDAVITSFAPTQTSYTITMNTGTTVSDNDYVKGISIKIKPTQTALQNGTIYNFNMTLNSSYWDVSLFGFTLEDVNGNVLNSSSSTAGSGTVSATWNTSNYTKVYMQYYYVINSTYTNYSRAWTIYDSESGIGFGLLTFFTDLRNYFTTGDGLFGSTQFALAIITFFAIFLITGVFAYSFGISSPATISGLIFGLVLFFDVGVGLLPNVNDNHVITLIMAIITIALFAREVSR